MKRLHKTVVVSGQIIKAGDGKLLRIVEVDDPGRPPVPELLDKGIPDKNRPR